MISYFRLWRLLDRRGYSKRDIIKLAGISESTFRKLVNKEAVRMDVLERLCDALNVDVGDMLQVIGSALNTLFALHFVCSIFGLNDLMNSVKVRSLKISAPSQSNKVLNSNINTFKLLSYLPECSLYRKCIQVPCNDLTSIGMLGSLLLTGTL